VEKKLFVELSKIYGRNPSEIHKYFPTHTFAHIKNFFTNHWEKLNLREICGGKIIDG
jgi:hypothetical protein